MDVKLLSDVVPNDKINHAEWFSYFLIYTDHEGARELLPSDNHSAAYPLTIKEDGSLLRGNVNFYNASFYKGFSTIKLLPEIDFHFNSFVRKYSKCLVINTLDNCYGHSLLKMFNIPLFHSKYGNEYDLLVITSPSLSGFFPEGRINTCVVNKTFRQTGEGYSLKPIIDLIKEKYESIEFAFMNTYMDYPDKIIQFDFFNFYNSGEKNINKRNIIYYYRKDKLRRWGLFSSKKNIINYFNFLSKYFEGVEFIVIGEKDRYVFPEMVKDYRCENFSTPTEYYYNSLLKNSLFVTGIHGSHMILPSLLSRQAVHIIPDFKIKNINEDIFNYKRNAIQNLFSDLQIISINKVFPSGKKLAGIILLLFISSIEKEYKISLNEGGLFTDQESYIRKNYPELNYSKASKWWLRREKWLLRIHRMISWMS
jgi:hypothetical protein